MAEPVSAVSVASSVIVLSAEETVSPFDGTLELLVFSLHPASVSTMNAAIMIDVNFFIIPPFWF